MALTRFASNGTLRHGATTTQAGSLIAKAVDLTINTKSNAELVVCNSGEVGVTEGHPTVEIDGKCAVARASAERKRLLRIYQNKEQTAMRYRSGDMEFVAEGIIESCVLASKANAVDTFDFKFIGTEQPIQDV